MADLLWYIGLYYELGYGGNIIVTILCVLSIISGIISCFFGYKVFKFIVGVFGFIIGALLGFFVGVAFLDAEGFMVFLSTILFAVLGAWLAVKIYYLGIFLIGALFGGLVGFTLTLGMDNGGEGVIITLLALVAGILAVVIKRFMIILSTAISGAQGISMAVVILVYIRSTSDSFDIVYNVLWIILAIAGFCYQYATNKKSYADPLAQEGGNTGSVGKYFNAQNMQKFKVPIIVLAIIAILILLSRSTMLLPVVIIGAILFFVGRKLSKAGSEVKSGGASAGAVGSGSSGSGGTGASSSGSSGSGGTGASSSGSSGSGGMGAGVSGSVANASGSTATASPSTGGTGSSAIIECKACHKVNPIGSKFCMNCGAALASQVALVQENLQDKEQTNINTEAYSEVHTDIPTNVPADIHNDLHNKEQKNIPADIHGEALAHGEIAIAAGEEPLAHGEIATAEEPVAADVEFSATVIIDNENTGISEQ